MSGKRYLWIVPKWPLPPLDGARVATCALLRGLSRGGEKIDLLALAGADEDVDAEAAKAELGVEHVLVVRRKPFDRRRLTLLLSFLSRPLLPVTFVRYAEAGLARAIRELRGSRSWDVVVYDGLHTAVPGARWGRYSRNGQAAACVLYRAHNCEHELWIQKAEQERSVLLRSFLRFQSRRVKLFEETVLAGVDAVAAVSAEDTEAFKRLCPELRCAVVPIGRTFDVLPAAPEPGPPEVLFLGRLDWLPNRQGLEWLLTRMWPQVVERRPDLRLTIVGSGDDRWLKRFRELPNVQHLGCAQDLAPVFARVLLTVVPIFFGSGTRVKAIEAACYGRACVSTGLGVAGLGLEDRGSYVRAETEEEWVAALAEIGREQAAALGRAAFERCRERFEVARAAAEFQRLVDGVWRAR